MTDTNTAPDMTAAPVERGICLICQGEWPLTSSSVVVRHAVDPKVLGNHAEFAETFADQLICLGAGHHPQRDDGCDDGRRFGVRHYATAAALQRKYQAKLDGLGFAAGLDHAGEAVVVHEELARLWREFAGHGSWQVGVRNALGRAIVRSNVTDPLRAGVMHAQALAARQWLREAKWELARAYADGVPAEVFAAMLFEV